MLVRTYCMSFQTESIFSLSDAGDGSRRTVKCAERKVEGAEALIYGCVCLSA